VESFTDSGLAVNRALRDMTTITGGRTDRDSDRQEILERIQEAFQTLRDPAKRKEYDLALLRHAPYFPPQAPFRKSVGKLEIDEAPPRQTLWSRIKRLWARNP